MMERTYVDGTPNFVTPKKKQMSDSQCDKGINSLPFARSSIHSFPIHQEAGRLP